MIFGSEIVSDAFRWGFRTMPIIIDRQMMRGVGNHRRCATPAPSLRAYEMNALKRTCGRMVRCVLFGRFHGNAGRAPRGTDVRL
jgi:hypothetical protein